MLTSIQNKHPDNPLFDLIGDYLDDEDGEGDNDNQKSEESSSKGGSGSATARVEEPFDILDEMIDAFFANLRHMVGDVVYPYKKRLSNADASPSASQVMTQSNSSETLASSASTSVAWYACLDQSKLISSVSMP